MRVLFTFVGGRGHFEPLAPIARAAAAAGHTVAFAAGSLLTPAVEAAGFEAFAVAPVQEPPKRKPLVAVDLEREERVLREAFAGWMARERAPAVVALCGEWRPDVLVCDEVDLGSMVAAERLGVPYAIVLENASGSFVRPEVLAGPADALRAEHGLPPGSRASLVLSPFPPSLRTPPAGAVAVRPTLEPAPPFEGVEDAVLFTLGTVFNLEAGDLFTRVLSGLRTVGVDVLVTVGHGVDPAQLGPQPAHVLVERYVPLSAALLEQLSYRDAAERLRDEIETLPGPDHAVALLNTLAS